ncbi:MAG: hypothetical protein U1A78_16625 [Polyangia bacterium]
MAAQDDLQLRGFMKGALRAEQAEAAEGVDMPAPEADEQIARLMVGRYGAPPPRRLWVRTSALVGAAALAATVLYLRPWEVEPLPPLAYGLEVQAHGQLLGTQPIPQATKYEMRIDSHLRLRLRPPSAEREPVQVTAFIRSGPSYASWPVTLQQFQGGTFLLDQPLRALPGLGPGRFELAFVLARGSLPPDSWLKQQLDAGATGCGKGCQILRMAPIEITEAAPPAPGK